MMVISTRAMMMTWEPTCRMRCQPNSSPNAEEQQHQAQVGQQPDGVHVLDGGIGQGDGADAEAGQQREGADEDRRPSGIPGPAAGAACGKATRATPANAMVMAKSPEQPDLFRGQRWRQQRYQTVDSRLPPGNFDELTPL